MCIPMLSYVIYCTQPIYVGEWIDGKMHGPGTYYFANGDVYQGE
jgi:hypothetical protein